MICRLYLVRLPDRDIVSSADVEALWPDDFYKLGKEVFRLCAQVQEFDDDYKKYRIEIVARPSGIPENYCDEPDCPSCNGIGADGHIY